MIPLWLKISYTALVCLVVPIYWRHYGPSNFLWFSDIALILTAVALWAENRLMASTMAVGVLLPEIVWNIAYFGRLLTGYQFAGIAGYMFDPNSSIFLRNLSLFHVLLPIVLVYAVHRLGYDSRAWLMMSVIAWIILPITYFFTRHEYNVNWVLGIGKPQTWMPPLAYLGLIMILFPTLLYLPTHLLLRALFRR